MFRGRICVVAILCLIPVLAQQQFPLETITAEGIDIPAPILAKLTGLKIGDPVDDAAFQAAARKLQQTGLFAEVGFRYTPGPKKLGYALILNLKDHPQRIPALFDFPGKSEAPIWACVKQQYPWLSNRIPTAGTAQDSIARAVESCAGVTPVVANMENDLANGRSQIVFQPKDLPKVESLLFAGTEKLTAKIVEERLATTALHTAFTERRFRDLLELNIRPLYESYGMLNVQFPSITFAPGASGVTVTTTIEEGLIYKLAAVSIEGPELPADVSSGQAKFKIGKTAAWPEILKSVEDLEVPLRKTGYIRVRSGTRRALDDSNATLALTVHVEKGRQYFFNSLSIEGAGKVDERLRKVWKLAPGSPMDQPYMTEYHKALFQTPELKGLKISVAMKPPVGDKIDVVVKIE